MNLSPKRGNEARFRLELAHFADRAEFGFKGDVVADALTERIDLDVRQALVTLQLSSALALRAGRQVMTWGTGDLVFLNDLFPKDFVAFFIGRSDEFLKAPANALRATAYTEAANVDAVWLPRFTPDRYITGERLSFFDPGLGRRVGMETLSAPLDALRPEATLNHGDDPFLPNSQLRALAGHERELLPDLTLGLQYYLEHTLHHDALLASSSAAAFEPRATRHVVTSRWTYRLRQQTLTLSLFSFWSPSDGDAHLRPLAQYQWSDAVALALGGHVFFGEAPTFFGQLADNTNAYARVRYSF